MALICCLKTVHFVCFFVEIRRRTIFKSNILGWSHTFNRFYCTDFHNLHFDMEVHNRNHNEIFHQFIINETMIYYIFFRFIKSDQNKMMLNLCASLVLAYVVFISSVEQTDNEVHTLTFIITIICAMK